MQVSGTDHAEPKELVPAPNYRVNFWDRLSSKTSWSLAVNRPGNYAASLLAASSGNEPLISS